MTARMANRTGLDDGDGWVSWSESATQVDGVCHRVEPSVKRLLRLFLGRRHAAGTEACGHGKSIAHRSNYRDGGVVTVHLD